MSLFKCGKKLNKFFFILILFLSIRCYAQELQFPLSNEHNLSILNNYDAKAKELAAKNLNRFALDRLHAYNFFLDSLYKTEKSDTLSKIEGSYLAGSKNQRTDISNLQNQINELTAEKENLSKRYWALVRRAVFSFALWLIIILLLLHFRKRKLKKAQVKFQDATTQLQALDRSSENAQKLFSEFSGIQNTFQKVNTELEKLSGIIKDGLDSPKAPEEWSVISTKTAKIKTAIAVNERIIAGIISQIENQPEEDSKTDINALCDQYLEIVSRGFNKSESLNIQVTKDLEKNLPQLKMKSNAIGDLLLNVLTNAFQSVKEKSEKDKTFQPKVTISTRILPRFLQIRVKDNGLGMNDENITNAMKEFYSTRSLEDGAGLGLSVSNTIISEMHKGEIKIESEEGNSTDVYIKFFI
jgi:signal transduction histidine kinase